jgi:hypothetical protein
MGVSTHCRAWFPPNWVNVARSRPGERTHWGQNAQNIWITMAAYTRISSAQAKCAVIHNCMLASAAAAISIAATPAGLAAPFFTNYNNTNGLAQNS